MHFSLCDEHPPKNFLFAHGEKNIIVIDIRVLQCYSYNVNSIIQNVFHNME